MNNKVFLVIAILFIVMILVDFVFNFTGILRENFGIFNVEETASNIVEQIKQSNNNAANNAANNASNNAVSRTSDKSLTRKIYSVISHQFGTVNAVIPLTDRVPTSKVLFLVKNNIALSMSKDNTLKRKLANKFDRSQHFRLVRIENNEDIENVLNGESYLVTEGVEYPFYFIQSVTSPEYFITKNSDDTITLENGRNSSRQRFDVSNEEVLPGIKDGDSNTVRIQLKLDDNSLQSILEELKSDDTYNVNGNNNSDLNNSAEFNNINNFNNDFNNDFFIQGDEDCDIANYLPREAVESLCPSCDTELL
jgi:hypothetical protein